MSTGSSQQQQTTTAGLSPWSQNYVSSMLGAAQQQVFNTDPATGQVTGIVPYQAFGSPLSGSQAPAQSGGAFGGLSGGYAVDQALPMPASQMNLGGGFNPWPGQGPNGEALEYDGPNSFSRLSPPATDAASQQAVAPSQGLAGMGPGEMQAARAAVAGPSGLQQQAYGSAYGMQTPEAMNQAQRAATAGISGLLNTPSFTQPGAMDQYMSPYMQGVVGVQQQQAIKQANAANQAQNAQAARAGALGGGRDAVMRAQQNAALQSQLQGIQAQGLQSAYTQGQSQFNTEQQNRLAALQSALSGAGQLSNIGGQQLGAQQSIANLQNTFGQQQQANQQNVINQAMQNFQQQKMYPQTQLSYLSSLLSGLPVSSSGSTTTIPAPSLVSQLGGLGTSAVGAAGLYKSITGDGIGKLLGFKHGGKVPSGIADLGMYNAMKR